MKSQEEIIKDHPSICYSCARSRKPVSNDFLQEGLVGCTLLAEDIDVDTANIECEEAYTGWVYLKVKPFTWEFPILSKVWTNCQLMTLKTTKCKYYRNEDTKGQQTIS